MKRASIDIGTNTLRLLIADIDEEGALKPLVHRRYITRLGGGFSDTEGIGEEAASRAFAALEEVGATLLEEAPEKVCAVATSAVRRAGNKEWFTSEGKRRLGYDIKVIDGDTEARLTLAGVLSVLDAPGSSKKRLVMDIGGGSTEFVLADGPGQCRSFSMELGVVHLTESIITNDPPGIEELDALKDAISSVISELKERIRAVGIDPLEFSGASGGEFVGTAGTVTTLSAISQAMEVYDPAMINGTVLTCEEVERIYKWLAGLTIEDRLKIKALEEGREDLIVTGTAIVLLAMRAFGFKRMTVSDAGLLEGILIDGDC